MTKKKTNSADRLMIKERVARNLEFDGKVDDVINMLQNYIATYGSDIEIEAEYYGYDGGVEYNLNSYRIETDEEYNKRQQQLTKQRERQAEQKKKQIEKKKLELSKLEKEERELYEKLKEKYS